MQVLECVDQRESLVVLVARHRALARVCDRRVKGFDLQEEVLLIVVFICVSSFMGIEWRVRKGLT